MLSSCAVPNIRASARTHPFLGRGRSAGEQSLLRNTVNVRRKSRFCGRTCLAVRADASSELEDGQIERVRVARPVFLFQTRATNRTPSPALLRPPDRRIRRNFDQAGKPSFSGGLPQDHSVRKLTSDALNFSRRLLPCLTPSHSHVHLKSLTIDQLKQVCTSFLMNATSLIQDVSHLAHTIFQVDTEALSPSLLFRSPKNCELDLIYNVSQTGGHLGSRCEHVEKLLVDYPEIEKASAILFLFDSCRSNAFASLYHSLGVIELTVALNYVFDQPTVKATHAYSLFYIRVDVSDYW